MKRFVAIIAGLLTAVCVWGQGQVDFNNAVSINAYIYEVGGSPPLAGSAYRADLYYGPTNAHPSTFANLGLAVPFTTISNLYGFFFGGKQTIPGFPGGSKVAIQVRAWRYSDGANWQAAANNGGHVSAIDPTVNRPVIVSLGDTTSQPPTPALPLQGFIGHSLIVNTAPTLTVPANLTIDELTALIVTNIVTDNDLPPETFTFALLNGPGGASLNPATGVLTWTPAEDQGPSIANFTVKVSDNGPGFLSATQSFSVTVQEVNVGPVLTVPTNQVIAEMTTLTVTNIATDSDIPANTLTFALVSAPSGVNLNPTSGVLTWTPTEAEGPSTNTITVKVFDNGTPVLSATQSFTVIVQEVNVAPVLTVPTNQTIAELTTLTVTNIATDSDIPANTLTFALVSAPSGVNLNPATGVLTWTPTEAEGPGTNTITVKVFDNGTPSLSDTQSFTVIVQEVNVAPVLTVPTNQTIAELTTLTVTNHATDSDIPTNTLTFALVSAPTGVNLNPATGVLTWTPTEAEGPGTNTITVKVFDNGTPSLSDTQSFTVIVQEVNVAPVLTVPTNQTIAELTTLTVTNIATDSDIPTNTLTFALVSAPTGVNLNPATGVLTWTPTEAEGPGTNTITVKVFDNGTPSLSATQSFTVIVQEVNVAPVLTVPTNQTIAELTTLTVTNHATDSDIPTNTLTFALVSAPSGVNLNPATGVLTWTPTEAEGPGTNTITVKVFDNGTPVLSATQSFTVIVQEVNVAPVLTVPTNQTIAEMTTLTVTNIATDSDIPTNTLTFALVSAPTGVNLNPTSGVLTWTPTEAEGPSTNTITVKVFDNGTPVLSGTQSFTVVVQEVNVAPVLTVPTNQVIAEMTTLTVTNIATDSDIPTNTLTFALVSAPSGVNLNPTSGVLTWTPTEAEGPGTNTITVKVFDNGTPVLSGTQSFTVVVQEVNVAPVLTVPTNQTIAEMTTLTVTNIATDSDIPTNTLTFALVSAPSGVNLNPATGVLTWTPTEAEGPGTNTITVKVFDNGTPVLSATQSFTVIVQEVNVAPVLQPIADTEIHREQTLTLTAQATDADLPANLLTFTLLSPAPAGATIGAQSGVLTWTAANSAPDTNHFTIKVSDDGIPSLSATQSFTLVIRPKPTLQIAATTVATTNEVLIGWSAIAGKRYQPQYTTDITSTNWVNLGSEVLSATNTASVFDIPASGPQVKFYRLEVKP